MTQSSKREVRALLWLLPVLAVASWLVWEVTRPNATTPETTSLRETAGEEITQIMADSLPNGRSTPNDGSAPTDTAENSPTPQLFDFDPNTVEYHDLVRLGFTRGEALGIVKYRERGKIFEIPEDFAACYQVSEAMYRRLEPHIRIGEKFRLQKFERFASSGTSISSRKTADVEPTEIFAGVNGVASTEEQKTVASAPSSRENRPTLVDLNTADSTALVSVSGIGALTASRIMEYRARLGGFAAVEQLAEIRGMTEQNYERIIEQIYIDPAVIQKIDINFAPAKTLAAHPYIKAEALRKLLKERQLKGGWRTPEELVDDNIFTAEELTKLVPYLLFK
jgi:competence ComEA-like helix-hairpin-helix protein